MKLKENIIELKKYWQIIYAVVLIFLIPFAIIANTFWITKSFEDNINIQLRQQALALAQVFNGAVEPELQNPEALQAALNRVAKRNPDVRVVDISIPKGENFEVIVSTDPDRIGREITDLNHVISWHQQTAYAKLTNAAAISVGDPLATRKFENLQEKFWQVIIPMFETVEGEDQKQALLTLNMSISFVDSLVQQTLIRSYIVLSVAVIIVMLLLIANTRLFQYALLARKLKEVEKLKDEFISMASHELRTPITSLRGYLSLLADGSLGDLSDLAKEKVGMMSSSADRLSELVEDLLNVSRIEQGRLTINFDIIDPVEVVEKVVNELSVQAENKHLQLVYEKPDESLPKLLVDEKRLQQILINIIGNAIKYTPKGSVTVTTKVLVEDGVVEIKCADTGLGMTAKQRERLFQKFYRVKTKETETIKGTGLGLWITKQLIELMDGSIFVDSIVDVGSQFTITFPIKTEKAMAAILSKQDNETKAEAQKIHEKETSKK